MALARTYADVPSDGSRLVGDPDGFADFAKTPEGVGAMSQKHMGSSVDDFLKEEGIFEEAQAFEEVVAWQLAEAREKQKISKNKWRCYSRQAGHKLIAFSI